MKRPSIILIALLFFSFCSGTSKPDCNITLNLENGSTELPLALPLSEFTPDQFGLIPFEDQSELEERYGYKVFENESLNVLFDEEDILFSFAITAKFENVCINESSIKKMRVPEIEKALQMKGVVIERPNSIRITQFQGNQLILRLQHKGKILQEILVSISLSGN